MGRLECLFIGIEWLLQNSKPPIVGPNTVGNYTFGKGREQCEGTHGQGAERTLVGRFLWPPNAFTIIQFDFSLFEH